MTEYAKGAYRPRRPRETPFYRIVEEHFERFEQVYPDRYEDKYGYLRSAIRETVYKYLNCGDLKQGFARVRCADCGHEYLLAFSCKGRYFCTSCHTKRAVAFAEWLHTTILLPVPHRQIVLTIPTMLGISFRYDRRLLGDLCRVAAGVIVESFRVLLALPQAQAKFNHGLCPGGVPNNFSTRAGGSKGRAVARCYAPNRFTGSSTGVVLIGRFMVPPPCLR